MVSITAILALAAAAPLPASVQNPDFDAGTGGWLFHVSQGGQLDWDAVRGDPAPGSAHVGNVWTSARYDAWSQCVALSPGAYDIEAQVASSVQTGNACELRVVLVDQPDCNIDAHILVDQRIANTRNDGTFETLAASGVAPLQGGSAEWPPALPHNPVSEPDLDRAETIDFKFEWVGAMTDYSKGQATPSLWQINGVAWQGGEEHKHNAPPLAKLELGKSYIFTLRNLTQYQHPIHLHGMTFKVLASNRRKIIPYYSDTYLLGKNESAKVALVADNPGLWMFHCHVIDHMETGLMGTIAVGDAWCG